MTQIIEKVMEKKAQESEQIESDEILGDLNPKYFEEAYSLEEAKNRAEASQLSAGSNNNFFGGF